MKTSLPMVTALFAIPFFTAAYSAESLENWDENGDGDVSLNEWDRNFEERDVFFRLKERQESQAGNDNEDGEFEFALPHLEEAYRANASVELFTHFDRDESGVLEEAEFRQFADLLNRGA